MSGCGKKGILGEVILFGETPLDPTPPSLPWVRVFGLKAVRFT